VKPPRFAYHAPATVGEALELLGEYGDGSKVLAGGQSLIPVLSFRLSAPEHLVDINRLPGLGEFSRLPAGGWRIPALVRQRQAERSAALAESAPLLTEALTQVAHPQIRNRGTICGSLAHADSSAEMPAVMLALNARMTIASASGTRVVGADDFFVFHMTTAISADELLLAVEFDDAAPRTYTSFTEFAPRKGDFCLAGVAATVTFGEDGTVAGGRVVAAGVAATPLRLRPVEDLITGSALDADALTAAQRAARDAVSPSGDVHADAAYRRQLVSVLVRRALSAVNAKKESNDGA
jgi:aerobic carbon-monoxide dehydrogenase medium subunit